MTTIDIEKKDNNEDNVKGGTRPLVIFMVGLVVFLVLLKLIMNYIQK